MHNLLRNPYFMGIVAYQGIHYEDKHPKLVEPEIWLAVQDTLAAHNHTGEKNRKHPHYLRGTIYCSACGGRLVYSQNTGRGGTYQYYFCVKRKTKTNNCQRPAMRLERIEDAIDNFYRTFKISQERAEHIRQAIQHELAAQLAEGHRNRTTANKRLRILTDERQKLLQAHYAGAVPQDLLASEMQRLTRAMTEAEAEVTISTQTTEDITEVLDAAVLVASRCEAAYHQAPPHVRRQINQGFLKRLLIGPDGNIERYELTEPFSALLDQPPASAANSAAQVVKDTADDPKPADRTSPSAVFRATFTESNKEATPRDICLERGVNDLCLVALRDSLSNMNPPLVRLLEAVEGGLVATEDHAVALDEDACVAREVAENRILSPDEVAELVESYRRGVAVLELARRFGVHRHTVDRHLVKAGVAKRPLIRMAPELLAKAVELYGQGLSVAKVGKVLGVSASTVYSTFVREGVRMRASKRSMSS